MDKDGMVVVDPNTLPEIKNELEKDWDEEDINNFTIHEIGVGKKLKAEMVIKILN